MKLKAIVLVCLLVLVVVTYYFSQQYTSKKNSKTDSNQQISKPYLNTRKLYTHEQVSFNYDSSLSVKIAGDFDNSLYKPGDIVIENPSSNACFESFNPTVVIRIHSNNTSASLKDFIKIMHNYKTMAGDKYVYDMFTVDNYLDENTFEYEGSIWEMPMKYYILRKGATYVQLFLYGSCSVGGSYSDQEEYEFYKLVDSLKIS